MPAQAPIQALRVSVVTSATISAGITSAAQMRSFSRNRIRAVAMHATSISWPEYVMYRPSAPCGRWPRWSNLKMPNWTMPRIALIAPMVMMMSTTVSARRPGSSRYAIGTMEKSSSCLQSMMLVRGSTERAAETSVAPAYAASGQNIRGTSMRSRRAMRSATHRTPVMVRSTSGGDDRQLERRGERQQRVVRRALEPARLVRRLDRGHHTRRAIARSAAERTSSGLNVVRHRKSPGAQTR